MFSICAGEELVSPNNEDKYRKVAYPIVAEDRRGKRKQIKTNREKDTTDTILLEKMFAGRIAKPAAYSCIY